MIKTVSALTLSVLVFALPWAGFGADQTNKPVPDKLTTCPVSGEKLDEMGKPYVFEYKAQEVKLCCKSCRKDFDKDPAKYMKKIREADQTPAPKKNAKN
jgi:YHS domain-containing protein